MYTKALGLILRIGRRGRRRRGEDIDLEERVVMREMGQ